MSSQLAKSTEPAVDKAAASTVVQLPRSSNISDHSDRVADNPAKGEHKASETRNKTSPETAKSRGEAHTRAQIAEDRRSKRVARVGQQRTFIPRNWGWMAAIIGSSMAISMLISLSVMPLLTAVSGGVAVILLAFGNMLAEWERVGDRPKFAVICAILATVVLPLGLTGFAYAYWLFTGAYSWSWGISVLLSINAFSSTLLSRRVPLLFLGVFAVWAPLAMFDGSFESFTSLALAAIVMLFVSRIQARRDRDFERRQAILDRRRNRYRELLNEYEKAGLGWFWETDRHGNLTYISDKVAKILGTMSSELVGTPFLDIFLLGEDKAEGERTLTFQVSARSSFQELPVRAAVESEEERWWSVSGQPMYDGFKNFVGFRGSGADLTEQRRSQQNASRLAHYDSLTGLANRMQMGQTLDKILNSPRESQRECALLLLDLDRFKQVNDTMGHPVGDVLLKQVAQRLERIVDKKGQVGRLGGDEFQIILPGRQDREILAVLGRDIIHGLTQPYSINGQRVVIGASIGIARAPSDGDTNDALIRNADLALYAAKDGGRGRYHFYSEDLHSAAKERGELESDLRDAISNGGLELYYQPVVYAASEEITGFEALLRWNHPKHGWLSPEKFVAIAEDCGLIESIGEWAIRTACHDLAKWPESIRCAVNVSPLQFSNPQLPAILTNALAQSGITPSRLELEITESVFLADDEGTDAMFAALKGVGVRLALDDFGTGYSSLSYLKKAPFDKIKIDQSFVRGATAPGSRNGAIIASISSLAQALGMDTTAEGVETLDELELVRSHGCSHIQGYIYDKALSIEEATQRVQSGQKAVARGPRSWRAKRIKMLRKVLLDHNGQFYNGTIRNTSDTGALITGLWNVPPGTEFNIAISETLIMKATSRWAVKDQMGVEFAEPLKRDAAGQIIGIAKDSDHVRRPLRKAG